MRRAAAALIGGAVLLLAPALAGAQTGLDIMQKQRQLQRVADEEEVQLLRVVSRSGATRERRLVRQTRTGPDGLTKTLLRFVAPRDVENTALLTHERPDGDDDQWLYLPATRKVKRIASSSKKSRFMGTDFAYEDLRPENLAIHAYTHVGSDRVDGHETFVVEARPATERHAADSGYSRRTLWIRKDIHVTVKQEYHGKTGRLEKVGASRRLVNVTGTVWRPAETEMADVQAGTRTVVTLERRAVDQGLPDSLFTEMGLARDGR